MVDHANNHLGAMGLAAVHPQVLILLYQIVHLDMCSLVYYAEHLYGRNTPNVAYIIPDLSIIIMPPPTIVVGEALCFSVVRPSHLRRTVTHN